MRIQKIKHGIILALLLIGFFLYPWNLGIHFVILACIIFIFLDGSLTNPGSYLGYVLILDVFGPHYFGLMTLVFVLALFSTGLLGKFISFEKNVRGGIIFISAALFFYYSIFWGINQIVIQF